MNSQLWYLSGPPSDFNLVFINPRHVVMAKRKRHGPNGVAVTLLGAANSIDLTATFDEFVTWLASNRD
jgi:hypothetical protein